MERPARPTHGLRFAEPEKTPTGQFEYGATTIRRSALLLLFARYGDLWWMRHTAVSQKSSPICNLMRILDSQRGSHAHEMAHEGEFLYQLHLPGTHCIGSWSGVFYSFFSKLTAPNYNLMGHPGKFVRSPMALTCGSLGG